MRPKSSSARWVLLAAVALALLNSVVAVAQTSDTAGSSDAPPVQLRIDHVALQVKDLPTSAQFYKQVFGFEVIHKWNTTWMIGKGRMRLGLFQRPNAMRPDDLNNYLVLQHFALLTTKTELAKYVKHLKLLGIKFEEDDSGIAKSIFIEDPDGIQVEVTYYYAEAPPRH